MFFCLILCFYLKVMSENDFGQLGNKVVVKVNC